MAQDIVPIELALTEGDVVTLWAPRWREEGEEWEAFLGHEEDLYTFRDAAHLAAFVRTAVDHDLVDHPAWRLVPDLLAPDLRPDDMHRYDIVGVPELVADDPDTWVLDDLAQIVTILRSLADVCDLPAVHEIIDSADAFTVLDAGPMAFAGREGRRMWTQLAATIADRWDEVLDALDGVTATPEVDARALATAFSELEAAEPAHATEDAAGDRATDEKDSDETATDSPASVSGNDRAKADPVLDFWTDVGIDPIRIVTANGEYYTLRCYLDDQPVFLGSAGTIEVFDSPRALARHLAAESEHDLTALSTWPEVATRATSGELRVAVSEENVYVLAGLAEDLGEGPEAVDPTELDLAVELLVDAATWAGDDKTTAALAGSEPLGWLISFVLRPDPTRLAPSAPFDAERAAWEALVAAFEARLRKH